MPEVLTCPSCQRKLQVPDTLLGQDVQCPTCGATFVAQVGGAAPSTYTPPPEDPPPSRALTRSSRRDDDDDYEDRPARIRKRRRSDYEPHRGSTIQLLGILSFFLVPLVLGPIAWILGSMDLKAMEAGRMDPSGEQETRTGRMCGMISTIVFASITAVSVLAIFVIYGSFCCCGMGMFGAAGSGGGAGRRY